MGDQQLLSLRDELEARLKPAQWGKQIQGAPKCVILMAKCKLMVSTPSAMALQLPSSNLKYDSLFANINHCIKIGQDTFKSTARRMERVGHLAHEMSKSGGTIEAMLKYIDPNQSAIRNKRFHTFLMEGLNSIGESVAEIHQVDEKLKEWVKVTDDLLGALGDKASSNQAQKMEAESRLKGQEDEKKRLENELEMEKKELEGLEKRFQRAIKTYEHIVNSLPATIAGAGGMVAAATAAGLAPEALAVGVAFGGVNYALLWAHRQAQKSTIRSLENETSTLRDTLKQLSGELQSIDEVKEIVRGTLEDLRLLQGQITHFMDFVLNIQKMVTIITDGKDRVFIKNLTLKDREDIQNDTDLKKEILSDALLMKNRFLIASKAAALYNEVSQAFVIPGVHWLIDGPDDAIIKDIGTWEAKICNGAEKLISKRIGELDLELEVLNRESLQSFKNVAPDLFTEMRGKVWEMNDEDLK